MTNPSTIAITGGSSGIGLALARHYHAQGWQVALCGRDLTLLEKAHAELGPARCLIHQADVARAEDCAAFAAAVEARFGPATVVVANAGISMRATFAELDLAVMRRLIDINLMGVIYTAKAFLPQLLATKGTLVGISSIAGHRGLPARTGYSASKAGLNGFLEALRTEMLDQGVNVLTVSPGFTASDIRVRALTASGQAQGASPLEEGSIMPAEEVARRTAHAVAARKRSLVLTGQGKFTVWMNKLFPAWMDRLVLNHFEKEAGNPLNNPAR